MNTGGWLLLCQPRTGRDLRPRILGCFGEQQFEGSAKVNLFLT